MTLFKNWYLSVCHVVSFFSARRLHLYTWPDQNAFIRKRADLIVGSGFPVNYYMSLLNWIVHFIRNTSPNFLRSERYIYHRPWELNSVLESIKRNATTNRSSRLSNCSNLKSSGWWYRNLIVWQNNEDDYCQVCLDADVDFETASFGDLFRISLGCALPILLSLL